MTADSAVAQRKSARTPGPALTRLFGGDAGELAGRSGLAADITLERFRADPDAACFVAYLVARRNLRRQFSLSGRTDPFDRVAEMLYARCVVAPDTDWWMVARAHGVPEVPARLSAEQRGELLGRWSALMGAAAGILGRIWDPEVDRSTMIVRRGLDSSTWNTIAQAYNTARAGWLAARASADHRAAAGRLRHREPGGLPAGGPRHRGGVLFGPAPLVARADPRRAAGRTGPVLIDFLGRDESQWLSECSLITLHG